MSDPRFSRLKNDPRFRRIRKKEAKVVVDDRFKSIFDEGKSKKKNKGKNRVDKYGRALSDTHEQDNLKRFYRLEGEEDEPTGEAAPKRPDFARGEGLLESSDEEDGSAAEDDESDTGGVVTLGEVKSRPISLLDREDQDAEIDLDESNLEELDAQAAAYAREHEDEDEVPEVDRTRRIAVVNLDWDHVRAIHLYKIFSSYVSPTAAPIASSSSGPRSDRKGGKGVASRIVRGKVLSVRVYPSEFGKQRLAKEEKEGPPIDLFNAKADEKDDRDLHESDNEADYNEDALRKYQLERLRYYYAIVECDSMETASHIYDELEGTELERSANVFDLSFVPDGMTFDDEPRDEATSDVNAPYRPVEFVTDALRHSRVKLTWDDDDPERNLLTRRALSKKEIEENDFRAYLASSSDESEVEDAPKSKKSQAERDRLRALLLSGGDDALPEGWGKEDEDGDDTNMEITFTPGLSESKPSREDETTLEKYQRKMKEKKKKRKEELKDKEKEKSGKDGKKKKGLEDDFFGGEDSDDEVVADVGVEDGDDDEGDLRPQQKSEMSAAELALIAASDNPNGEPKHFDMKAVLKAEKTKGKKRKGMKQKKSGEGEQELQEDFTIDVKDERFKALHEDHTFAIDPSNPHFKKTKSMAALLEERSKRQRVKLDSGDVRTAVQKSSGDSTTNLKSLVESVKRKSAAAGGGVGKRRKM